MCTNKAKVFYEALGLVGTLSASSGWLIKFMQRYGTHNSLYKENIHNADQIGLHWKGLPTKTVTLVNEDSAPGLGHLQNV